MTILSSPVAFAAAQQADLLTQAGLLDTPKLALRLKDDVLIPDHAIVVQPGANATQDDINNFAAAMIEVTAKAYRFAPGWDDVECKRSVSRLLTKQGTVQYLLDGTGYRLCFATCERTFTSPTMGTLTRSFPGVFVTQNNALKMDNLLRPFIEQMERTAEKRGDLLRLEAETNPALVSEMATLVNDVSLGFRRALMRGLGLPDGGGNTQNPGLPSGNQP